MAESDKQYTLEIYLQSSDPLSKQPHRANHRVVQQWEFKELVPDGPPSDVAMNYSGAFEMKMADTLKITIVDMTNELKSWSGSFKKGHEMYYGPTIVGIWTQGNKEIVNVPDFGHMKSGLLGDSKKKGWEKTIGSAELQQFRSDDDRSWEFSIDVDQEALGKGSKAIKEHHWIMDPQMDIRP